MRYLHRQLEAQVQRAARNFPAVVLLRLFRPATVDLILTKMMRGEDPQDMEDVAFLLRHDGITAVQLEQALANAVTPDLAELREAFERAKRRVRELVTRNDPEN